MEKLIFILFICFGSVIIGTIVRYFCEKKGLLSEHQLIVVSSKIKIIGIFVLFPIAIVNMFWKMPEVPGNLLFYPLFGIVFLFTGGISALILSSKFQIHPLKAASVFVGGMFTNLGTIGGLICYVMFGTMGYLLANLFIVFEVFIYYLIGFPLSYLISKDQVKDFKLDFSGLKGKSYAFIQIFAIIVGLLLKWSSLAHPAIMDDVAGTIIPFVTGSIGFAIGITMKLGEINKNKREIALILTARHIIAPIVLLSFGFLTGMHNILDGIPIRVLLTLSFMPIGILASLPPVLYGFDLDLINSAWLVSMVLSMFIFFPIIYFAVM